MKGDVDIMQIVNIYHRNTTSWRRPQFVMRHYDAVVFFEEGEIEYNFSDTTVLARKGDILLLPGNLPYTGKCRADALSYYVVDFLCAEEYQMEEVGAPCSFSVVDPVKVLADFQKVLRLWGEQTINAKIATKAMLYSILSDVLHEQRQGVGSFAKLPIVDYILENISDVSLTVQGICNRFYISDSQLRRLMYQYVNLSPNEYIQMLRISKAKNLLSTTSEDIKGIAGKCGFSSQYYFSRVFSKIVGVSPSAYRRLTCI